MTRFIVIPNLTSGNDLAHLDLTAIFQVGGGVVTQIVMHSETKSGALRPEPFPCGTITSYSPLFFWSLQQYDTSESQQTRVSDGFYTTGLLSTDWIWRHQMVFSFVYFDLVYSFSTPKNSSILSFRASSFAKQGVRSLCSQVETERLFVHIHLYTPLSSCYMFISTFALLHLFPFLTRKLSNVTLVCHSSLSLWMNGMLTLYK